MDDSQNCNLADEQSFRSLLQGVADLQSSACDIDIERQDKQTSIFQEERDKSINNKNNEEEESLKIIKQTTDVARLAMILIVRGLQICATVASNKSKCFSSFSSALSYIRQQQDLYRPPAHLLLEWERNVVLFDMFTSDEGLYCNKRIAQDMFNICMETFDWLRSLANNNK
jgi:hypothetical protein